MDLWTKIRENLKVVAALGVVFICALTGIIIIISEGCQQSVRNLCLSAEERNLEVALSPVVKQVVRETAREEVRAATQPGGVLEEVRGRYHVPTSNPAVRLPLESGVLVQNYWMTMRDGSQGSCYAGDSLQVVDRVGDACVVTCVHLRNESDPRLREVPEGRGEDATAIIPYQEYQKLVGENATLRPVANNSRVQFSGPPPAVTVHEHRVSGEIKIPERIEVEVKRSPPPCSPCR